MGFGGDLLSGLGWLADPMDFAGTRKDKAATKVAAAAQSRANALADRANKSEPKLNKYIDQMPVGEGFQSYGNGLGMMAAEQDQLTDENAEALDLATDSAAESMAPSAYRGNKSAYNRTGLQDAYGDIGPSSWEGDSSAYGDIGFSEDALGGMGESRDYYGNLMEGGTDAQAEADYARRADQAERRRGANTQASLAALEAKGQGGSGNALLASLSNQQASASDQYLAGLDASATAQARRDASAGAYGEMSERMGTAELSGDEIRAAGLDTFNTNQNTGLDSFAQDTAAGQNDFGLQKAAGVDEFNLTQAGGMDDYATGRAQMTDEFNMEQRNQAVDIGEGNANREQDTRGANFNRANQIGDLNTGMENDIYYYNAITAPQQRFENVLGATGLATGTAAGTVAGMNREADNSLGKQLGMSVANAYTAGMAGKAKDRRDGPD